MKKLLTMGLVFFGLTYGYGLEAFTQQIKEKVDAQADPALKSFWSQLENKGCVEHTGKDSEFRPLYVKTQEIVEFILAHEKDLKVVAVIHTALPPTPLRTEPEKELATDLVALEIAKDKKRASTITSRAITLRRFLQNTNNILYACYPEDSLKSEIPGLSIYQDLVGKFSTLKNTPFKGALSAECSGATYAITDSKGNTQYFGILAKQANAPTDSAHWVMIYGPSTNEAIKKHIQAVGDFLKEKELNLFKIQ